MSRGRGRGGFRGGRGGRGGLAGGAQLPMGLTFADIKNLSREATALYPPMSTPALTEPSEDEARICKLQLGFADRLKKSQYYVIEKIKNTELPRYSDKYRPQTHAQPTLRRKDLHELFFPTEIFDDYFNLKRKRKVAAKSDRGKPRLNLDDLNENGEEQEKSSEERSDVGSQAEQSDYDVDEEYDNDYADNYFDNGEGDDPDDLGDGGGGRDEGGGGDYD